MGKTIRQHWIPRFIIRDWTINNCYKFYNKFSDTFGQANLKNLQNDVFYSDFLYEDENLFEFNKIENGLSVIESDFANILRNKILNQKETVTLNRLELKKVKLYFLIELYRLRTITKRAINLEGDFLYNKRYKNKSKEEINQEFLKRLDYLVFDLFGFIKENAGFLPKELQEEWEKEENEIQKIKDQSPEDLFNLAKEMKYNHFLNVAVNIYAKTCLKVIKISDDLDYNFLLTDSRMVQFFGESYSKIFGLPILELMPISSKYAIAFLRLDDFTKSEPINWAKDSFWANQFKNLFVKNHAFKMKYEKEIQNELFNQPRNINSKNWEKLQMDISLKYIDNEDLYKYPIYELTNKEQIWLINGMLHSQTYEYVCYKKGKDLLKANETIKKYGIHRIEDTNKNPIDFSQTDIK